MCVYENRAAAILLTLTAASCGTTPGAEPYPPPDATADRADVVAPGDRVSDATADRPDVRISDGPSAIDASIEMDASIVADSAPEPSDALLAFDSSTEVDSSSADAPPDAARDASDSSADTTTESGPKSDAGRFIEDIDIVSGIDIQIAIDSSDRPHVSYDQFPNGPLWYAVRTAAGWQHEIVSTQGSALTYHDIAIGADDRPCVLFSAGDATVRLACRRKAGGWDEEPVATGSGPVALAIDMSAHPHAAYRGGSNLVYATRDTAWTPTTMGQLGIYFVSLGVESNGRPHLVFGEQDGKVLQHATRSGAIWDISPIATVAGINVIGGADLTIDSADGLHVVYTNPSSATRRTYYRAPGANASWEELSEHEATGNVKVAFHPARGPHIAYRVAFTGYAALRLATRAGGTGAFLWEPVVEVNPVPAISIRGSGNVHIAFVDTTAHKVRYVVP